MNSKLFLGIILLITIISSMLMTITEGVCNYNDGGGIGGSGGGGSGGGSGDGGSGGAPGSAGSSGAPVTNRTSESCGEAGIYENAEKLKQAESKLNELKEIAAKVNQGVIGVNRKGILDNLRMAKELASAGGDGEGSDENPACEKYPSACGNDNSGFPEPVSKSSFQDALSG